MPKTIPQQQDIERQPVPGDLFVIETPQGTRKMDYNRLKQLFTPKKYIYPAAGGETEFIVPNFEGAYFSVVFVGTQWLDEYLAPDFSVPTLHYKAVYNQSKVVLGDVLEPNQSVLVIYY